MDVTRADPSTEWCRNHANLLPPTPKPSSQNHNKRKAKTWPEIYVNTLVDKHGRPLSANAWTRIIRDIRRYIADLRPGDGRGDVPYRRDQLRPDAEFIQRIDEQARNNSKSTYPESGRPHRATRRYMQHWDHVLQAQAFIDWWRAAINKYRDENPNYDPSTPLPWTACEAGWTFDTPYRYYMHIMSRTSSVPLMNLVDAIVHLDDYCMAHGAEIKFIVVMRCWTADMVPMAEHIHSRLNNTYANNGGFNTTAAGISHASDEAIPAGVYMDVIRDMIRERSYLVRLGEFVGLVDERNAKVLRTRELLDKREAYPAKRDEYLVQAAELRRQKAALDAAYDRAEACRDDLNPKLAEKLVAFRDAQAKAKMIHELLHIIEALATHKMAVARRHRLETPFM